MLETHWHECWRYTSHHACAVDEIERLQEELAQSVLNLEGHKKANLQLKEDLRLEAAADQRLQDRTIILIDILQEIHTEATKGRDWGVVEKATRGIFYPHLSEYLKGEDNDKQV